MEDDRNLAAQQRAALVAAGLSPEEVERAMQPMLSFHAQLEEEVRWYERIRSGDFSDVYRLTRLGQLLIALRVARGLSQRDLAQRLGIAESQVSRDERNEYHGITVERAQRIAEALDAEVILQVEQPMRKELVHV
jgi:DNA-binding Xre family transcriptional regulator